MEFNSAFEVLIATTAAHCTWSGLWFSTEDGTIVPKHAVAIISDNDS